MRDSPDDLPQIGDKQNRRSLHGFFDWIEFAKALAWMAAVLTTVFVTTLYLILDPRYMLKADGNDIKCEIYLSQITQLETEEQIVESKLRRATNDERNQLEDERGILSLKLVEVRRNALLHNCALERS